MINGTAANEIRVVAGNKYLEKENVIRLNSIKLRIIEYVKTLRYLKVLSFHNIQSPIRIRNGETIIFL